MTEHSPITAEPASTAPQPEMPLIDVDVRLIRIVMWLFLLVLLPLALISTLWVKGPWFELYPLATGLLTIPVVTLQLLHWQRIELARNFFLWAVTILILFHCMIVNGIRTPAAASLPVMALLSAWMGSKRQTLAICLLISVTLTAMSLLDQRFWAVQHARGAFSYWANYIACLLVATVITSKLSSAMRKHYSTQKKYAAQLAKHVDELQMEREKFSAFFYLNPVPVSISLLEDGRYYDINPAWEKTSGWTRQEILGRTSIELGIWVTTEEREEWVREFRKNGRCERQLTRFRLRDGKIRYFLASAEVIQYDGRACIFSAFVEITERREAEEKLRELNANLESRVAERTQSLAEANQSLAQTVDSLQRTQSELVHAETMASLGSMVAGISHELNTPIGNALTVSTALQDQVREFSLRIERGEITRQAMHNFLADQHHGADLAAQNMLRAAELITSFKQVAVDQASERRRGFELASTLGDILNTLKPMLKHQPVELRTEITSGIAMDSFPGPLGQVISNLVQNALLHGLGDAGGIIEISSRPVGDDSVEILVRDNGRGIKAEHMARIFDPFFTTRLGQGGSGLGLSIVHRLVSSVLGGSINVQSVEGEGCCFRVEIPRVAPKTDEA